MKMNKIIAVVMAVCVMGFGVPYVNAVTENNSVITASAESKKDTIGTYEQIKYKKCGDYIEIYGCNESATDVVIPAEIEGVPVTSIGEMAFYGCSSLTSIKIPDNVTSIGYKAFFSCTGLTSIEIPKSVISIEFGAFYDTPWFKARQAENPLVIVNNILIESPTCTGDVLIPNSVTSIGNGAFSMCSSLTSITITDSVTHIGNGAFSMCSSLTSIKIPNSVKIIGEKAFLGCSSLTEITILNPDCDIFDYKETISDTATIYGYENSTAQAYAEKYGRNFVSLGKAPEKETGSGDMNGDNSVNVADAVFLKKCILGIQELTEEQFKNADLTGDGFVDSFDMVMLRKKIIENIK